MLAKAGLLQSIMVDCSHANSEKDHTRQETVLHNVLAQLAAGNRTISSVMIESFLEDGNQPLGDATRLRYGVSITDKCVGWEATERMLRHAHAALKQQGGRQLADD
jgi:3-deoxy-7-phosphoheptulonate synthase